MHLPTRLTNQVRIKPRTNYKAVKYTEKEKRTISQTARDLLFKCDEDMELVREVLENNYNRELVDVEADGNCLFTAVLKQLKHHSTVKPQHLRFMTVYHILRNYDYFEDIVCEKIDNENREDLVPYLTQLLNSKTWADINLLQVIMDMFKITITVISPYIGKPLNMKHNESDPDIVIVANGGLEAADPKDQTTHFIATRKYI